MSHLRASGRRRGRGDPRIAIVGRGFSGAAAAAALLRVCGRFSLVLIDEAPTLGGGLAYGRARAGELLNVRARDLALLAEERGDFAAWLRGRLVNPEGGAAPIELGQIFAPRALFRDYTREKLLEEMLRRPEVSVQLVDGRATALAQNASGEFSIGFDRGPPVAADFAILAAGYGGASAPRRFGRDPFEPIPEDELARAREIVLVGSSLTMVDALLRLRRQGCAAHITIVSRHGLLPHSQLPRSPEPELQLNIRPAPLRDLLKDIRAVCRGAEARGGSWQAAVNALRPSTQDLWLGLTVEDQRRFLRHLRTLWDIHRHRLPADIHSEITREVTRKRTTVRAGRVIAVDDGLRPRVRVRWRGRKETETLNADIVLDCSGHRPNLDAPLLRSVIDNGLGSIDTHGIGLAVERDGRVQSGDGRLFAIGPLCVGTLFEIGAAPEIAAQARCLAQAISGECASLTQDARSRSFRR